MNPVLLAEYLAATQSVAIADLSARGRLRVTGGDRVRFLQGQFTNDIMKLQIGQGCYAALCNAKGKMRGDAVIYCLADSYLLDVEPGQAEPMRVGLERFIIADEVQVSDVSDALKQFTLVGPKSTKAILEWFPDVSPVLMSLNFYHFAQSGGSVIARSARSTVESYDVITSVDTKPKVDDWISADTLELLRIEAGIPRWGMDLDETTIPLEAGLESRAISYTKGCYIGQEVIARIHSMGHVNRHLVGLKIVGRVPLSGEKILQDGKEIGVVTSAGYSPREKGVLALGYVRREASAGGQPLFVGANSAEIVTLPNLKENHS